MIDPVSKRGYITIIGRYRIKADAGNAWINTVAISRTANNPNNMEEAAAAIRRAVDAVGRCPNQDRARIARMHG